MENKINVNLNVGVNIMSVNDLSLIDAVLDKFGVEGVDKINVNSVSEESAGVYYTSYPDNAVSSAAPIPTVDIGSLATQTTSTPTVPTLTTSFTVDDLIKAATPLVNSIGINALRDLLAKYGVVAINQLQPDQCANFALDLRSLGAAI